MRWCIDKKAKCDGLSATCEGCSYRLIEEREVAVANKAGLPIDAKDRKTYPIATGVIDYFPRALAAIAHVSWLGNQQHHPDKPLHWDRAKSTDEADAFMRHFVDRGTRDTDGARHTAKAAWRILALLEKELEAEEQSQGEPHVSVHSDEMGKQSAGTGDSWLTDWSRP